MQESQYRMPDLMLSGLGRLDLAALDAAAFACLTPGSDPLAGQAEDRSPVCPLAENA